MSTETPRTAESWAKWSVPGFFLGIGFICLVTATVGDHVGIGLLVFGVLALCSLSTFGLARRSQNYREAVEHPDERSRLINVHAWAGVGVILTVGNLCAFIGDLASGRTGNPYYWMLMVAAVAYVVLIRLLRRRF